MVVPMAMLAIQCAYVTAVADLGFGGGSAAADVTTLLRVPW
jgi:hypothetical protein